MPGLLVGSSVAAVKPVGQARPMVGVPAGPDAAASVPKGSCALPIMVPPPHVPAALFHVVPSNAIPLPSSYPASQPVPFTSVWSYMVPSEP